ncbi:hypothetical protein KW796_02510 [Candidatus Parcubacteria bacterium]|nr:hypothetical protein [Candidatus Parcubacteria bacterium]
MAMTNSGFHFGGKKQKTNPEPDEITDDARSNLTGFKWFGLIALVAIGGLALSHFVFRLF